MFSIVYVLNVSLTLKNICSTFPNPEEFLTWWRAQIKVLTFKTNCNWIFMVKGKKNNNNLNFVLLKGNSKKVKLLWKMFVSDLRGERIFPWIWKPRPKNIQILRPPKNVKVLRGKNLLKAIEYYWNIYLISAINDKHFSSFIFLFERQIKNLWPKFTCIHSFSILKLRFDPSLLRSCLWCQFGIG